MRVSKIIRIIISIIAFALLLWVNMNFFTAGTVIGSAVFGGAFVICVAWEPFCKLVNRLWKRLFGRIVLIFLGSVTAFCIVCCSVFTVNILTHAERDLENPEAVIVLGCQVRGEEPSEMLKRRLDAALEVLNENPEALCVVSGGQGSGEDISEAEAMRRYLAERGVSHDRIILEDRSVSTRENIAFSAELLKERGIDRAVIATNEFHQYRAGIYAKRNGLTVGHHSGKTRPYNLLNYLVREWTALFDAFVRAQTSTITKPHFPRRRRGNALNKLKQALLRNRIFPAAGGGKFFKQAQTSTITKPHFPRRRRGEIL